MDRRQRIVWWYVMMFGAMPLLVALDVVVALAWGHPMLPALLGGLLMDGVAVGVLVRIRRSLG
jgi:hypothetical protein